MRCKQDQLKDNYRKMYQKYLETTAPSKLSHTQIPEKKKKHYGRLKVSSLDVFY